MSRSDQSRIAQLEAVEHTARALREAITIGGRSGPRLLLARENLIVHAGQVLGSSVTGRGSGTSDPTLAAVMSRIDHDSARFATERARELAALDDAIDIAEDAICRAERLVTSNTIAAYHAPNNLRGCRQCGGVQGDDGKVHPDSWQPVANKATQLCSWCYRWQYGEGPSRPGYGEAPTAQILRWHLDHPGDTPPRALVRDLMPDAFRQREDAKQRDELPRCVTTYTDMTRCLVYRCIRPQGHEDEHRGVRDGQSFPFTTGVNA